MIFVWKSIANLPQPTQCIISNRETMGLVLARRHAHVPAIQLLQRIAAQTTWVGEIHGAHQLHITNRIIKEPLVVYCVADH